MFTPSVPSTTTLGAVKSRQNKLISTPVQPYSVKRLQQPGAPCTPPYLTQDPTTHRPLVQQPQRSHDPTPAFPCNRCCVCNLNAGWINVAPDKMRQGNCLDAILEMCPEKKRNGTQKAQRGQPVQWKTPLRKKEPNKALWQSKTPRCNTVKYNRLCVARYGYQVVSRPPSILPTQPREPMTRHLISDPVPTPAPAPSAPAPAACDGAPTRRRPMSTSCRNPPPPPACPAYPSKSPSSWPR